MIPSPYPIVRLPIRPKQITADLDAVASCPGGGEVVPVCDE